jgi:hypothetical protein
MTPTATTVAMGGPPPDPPPRTWGRAAAIVEVMAVGDGSAVTSGVDPALGRSRPASFGEDSSAVGSVDGAEEDTPPPPPPPAVGGGVGGG